MDHDIFREYDIRGVVDKQLTDEVVHLIGQGFSSFLAKRNVHRISVGRDCRLSSERFFSIISQSLIKSGIDIVDIGIVSTPVQYFSMIHLDLMGGIMITGSHNPKDYNGFKLSYQKTTIAGKDIQEVYHLIEKRDFVFGEGTITSINVIPDYHRHNIGQIRLGKRKLKVVIDAGNGMASNLAPDALEKLGVNFIPLYCKMDGNFPNHHPDPTVSENLHDLISMVKKEKADLGIAFDGDCDRIGAVDEKGNILWGDQLMVLYSRNILSQNPGATIIGEVKCSVNLYDDIKKHGGNGIMWKAGHSLIKAKMKETKALLAGEMSGHIFFKDKNYGYDDALYAALRLIELMSHSDQTLSQQLSDLPKTYSTPEIRVDSTEKEKFALVERTREAFKLTHDIIEVDGVRVIFKDGWGLLRASNTQPIVVLRFEAFSPESLNEIQASFKAKLNITF